MDDQLEVDLALVDKAIGERLRGAIMATLLLGHTDLRHTMKDYIGVADDNPAGQIVRLAVLGDAEGIRSRFPGLVADWERLAARTLEAVFLKP